MTVERDGDHQRGDACVGDSAHEVALRCAEQPMGGGHDRVAAGPHRHGGEPEGDQQRDTRPDEPAPDAEECAAGHRHVGAGARSDDRGGQHGQRADGGADDHRGDGLPEGQAEQDGERAEHHVRPGQVRAEEHRAQVSRV